ncbi:MAG: hypothetical protein BWY86_00450 [Candidatus Aminicenantes bacterium ADurb.Bin508]|nr:MAG: hypothetical protein BWY86_00450 [Candidatus Aminicenantes bacterium ADurb.Bin508]
MGTNLLLGELLGLRILPLHGDEPSPLDGEPEGVGEGGVPAPSGGNGKEAVALSEVYRWGVGFGAGKVSPFAGGIEDAAGYVNVLPVDFDNHLRARGGDLDELGLVEPLGGLFGDSLDLPVVNVHGTILFEELQSEPGHGCYPSASGGETLPEVGVGQGEGGRQEEDLAVRGPLQELLGSVGPVSGLGGGVREEVGGDPFVLEDPEHPVGQGRGASKTLSQRFIEERVPVLNDDDDLLPVVVAHVDREGVQYSLIDDVHPDPPKKRRLPSL